MVRSLRLLLALVALIVIVAFAIANRTPVDVSFAPLPMTIELPLYGAFLFGLIIGTLVGGIGVWLGGLAQRHRARRLRSRVWALENQLSLLKQQEEKAQAERYGAQKSLALQAAGD
jgi:lipopolysaccharide assembly protein A